MDWNLGEVSEADQNLDVYHATEYLTELARAGFGDDGAAVKEWSKAAKNSWWPTVGQDCAFVNGEC